MIKDRNGTVQASGLDSDAVRCKLEVKTTKLGKTQNILATFIVLWPTQQPSHISLYRNTTIIRSVRMLRYCRNVRPTWVKFNSKDTKESEWCSRF